MTAAVRICLVSGEYPPDRGGVADYTLCLAEALVAEGHAVDVMAPRRSPSERADRPASRLGNGGGSARAAVDRASSDGRVTVFRLAGVWGWALPGAMQRLVDRVRPDVMHLQYQTAAFGMHPGVNIAPWWLRRAGQTKLAVTYHDLGVPYLFPKAGRVRRWVTLLPARWCHLTIATNDADYAALALDGRPWQLDLVPIGSNVPDEPPEGFARRGWLERAGVDSGAIVVGYFGMLNASKGARTLVAAIAHLLRSGRDVRLVMIGDVVGTSDPTNAAYRAAVEADMAEHGLAEHVQWTGHLEAAQVSAWMHAVHVVALPYVDGASFRRGSLMAALTHGRPIVTTAPRPLLADATLERGLPPLRDGEAVRLVAREDSVSLAAAIAQVADDAELAERLSRGARALAAHFTWPAIAARHSELYHGLLWGV